MGTDSTSASQNSFQANSDECLICQNAKNYVNWVACDLCRNWFHLKCLGLQRKDIPSNEFNCPTCKTAREPPTAPLSEITNSNDPIASTSGVSDPPGPTGSPLTENSTSSSESNSSSDSEESRYELIDLEGGQEDTQLVGSQTQASSSQSSSLTDEDGNSQIKEIVAFRTRRGVRQFRVRYLSNNELQWFKESDLTSCPIPLEAFCATKNIPMPKFILDMKQNGTFGNILKTGSNPKNWVTLHKIIEAVAKFGRKNSPLPQILTSLGTKTAIYILGLGNHCLVILHLPSTRTAYISDGQSAFLKDRDFRRICFSYLKGISFINFLPYLSQKAIDHCGSSAAGIAIEFQRALSTGAIPATIRSSATVINRIRKFLHPFRSKAVNRLLPPKMTKVLTQCPKCLQVFKTKSRAVLAIHKCRS